MRNLVTEKHFNAELDRRFTRLEAKISFLESRLVWRLFLLIIGVAGLAVAILRFG